MKKTYLAVGAAAVLVVLTVTAVMSLKKNNNPILNFAKNKIALKATFAAVEKNAFDLKGAQSGGQNNATVQNMGVAGSVNIGTTANNGSAEAQIKSLSSSAAPIAAAGRGGSGIAYSTPAMDKAMICQPDEKGGCVMPPQIRYEYVYKGDKIELAEAEMPVYKRVKGFGNNISAGDIFSSFNFDSVNLSKFQSAGVDSVSLTEVRDYGFSIYINFTEGNFSFNQNWAKWPHPEQKCQEQACYDSFRVKEPDLPSNDEAIKIADNFLREYGISLEGYGPGEAQDDWKIYYANTADKANYYFPETISIIYPQIIDSKPVLDEWGNKQGVNVSVGVRDRRVTGVWNLASQNYQTSLYPVETDQEKILELMKNANSSGGIMPMMAEGRDVSDSQNVEVRQIETGTPALGLARVWVYKADQSDELLVPALIFPVTKNEVQYNNQKLIVVPLVKEIIDQRNAQNGGGTVRIMEGGSSSGSSGSASIQSTPSAAPAPVESE